MNTIDDYDYECTKKCKWTQHGKAITSALSKISISDEKLAAYVAKTCRNFAEVTDTRGRTALHLAASVNRYALVKWLLNHGALINAKDSESGRSALHRAIFYGCIDCAVLLISYGASLDLHDDDHRVPLQDVCKLCDLQHNSNTRANNELLVWGTNKNFNLGYSAEQQRITPHFIDFFRKGKISITSVAISYYHSLFLDDKGFVYSVGHGRGGQLGIGSESTLPSPKKVIILKKHSDEKVIGISCSKNHSLLLTNKGNVYTCGLNTDYQLGIKPAPKMITSFKEINAFTQYGTEGLVKVIARETHSIAYNSKELFVWGANRGHFGINKDLSHILLPRQVNFVEKTILFADSNNCAIACCTSPKQIYVLYNYKVKAVRSPTMEDIANISIAGGEQSKTKSSAQSCLMLLVLTNAKNIYIWYEDTQKFLRCTFAVYRILDVDKIILRPENVMVLSGGDVYMGKITKLPIHNIESKKGAWSSWSYKNHICVDQKIRFDVKRLSNIDRAVNIACDDNFESFAVLQESSKKYYNPPELIFEDFYFKKLLNEATESDTIHDLVFHVDNETFCAHKFIIFLRSEGLRRIVEQFQDKDIYLNFKNLTGKMFHLILKHIYANYTLTEEDMDDIHQSLGPHPVDRLGVCELFLEFVEKFELTDLGVSLNKYVNNPDTTTSISGFFRPKYAFSRLKQTAFPNLYDVTIKCAGDREIRAHKCVLVTALEYFNMMFNNSWSENNTINMTTIPHEYMEPIIEFLYTNDVESFRRRNLSENCLYNIIVICDQLLINKLQKVCEVLILEKISINKSGDMLNFACAYNCNLLKRGCLDFICQNMSRVLIHRSLEICVPESLHHINLHYRKIFKDIFDFRIITPDYDVISDDKLDRFVLDFSVDLEYKMSEDSDKKIKYKTKLNKTEQSKRNYEKVAISCMKKLFFQDTVSELTVAKKISVDNDRNEPEAGSSRNDTELKPWVKVVEKKDINKKMNTVGSVKTNDVLKQENKKTGAFVSLNNILKNKTPTKLSQDIREENTDQHTPVVTKSVFDLSAYTLVKSEKISQKQRKRLSMENPETDRNVAASAPIPIQNHSNPWGTVASPNTDQPSFVNIMKSARTPTTTHKGSLENNVKSSPEVKPSSASSTPIVVGGVSKFSEILEDERRQKEHLEKMKSKSLVLTQIEEIVIAELNDFYNVDNVDDEIITIDRKNVPMTLNFSTWQRH